MVGALEVPRMTTDTDRLAFHAARAYAVPVVYVDAAMAAGVDLPDEWLHVHGFRGDPYTPEHYAYLVARRIAEALPRHATHADALVELGVSDGVEVVDRAFPPSWWVRLRRKVAVWG